MTIARRIYSLLLVFTCCIVSSCMMKPVAFGDLWLTDSSGKKIWGEFALPGLHRSKEEKQLTIRFFSNKTEKLTTVFEEKYTFETDSAWVTSTRKNGHRIDVEVRNLEGTRVFGRTYRLIGESPIQIVGSEL